MTACDTQSDLPGRPPALLARPTMERGSALWRFHTALDDLVVLTAVPAAAAVPEPADVAHVLKALTAGLRQLDPVLEQLADRLTTLADSPNAGTVDTAGTAAVASEIGAGETDIGGEVRCRVCGCTDEAACPGGCWWVPDPLGAGDLCSVCVGNCVGADTTAVLAAALTSLAAARRGLASTAEATAAAGGHARQLVLVDPDAHQRGPARQEPR